MSSEKAGATSVMGARPTGLPSALGWRHLVNAVLYEVRSWRRCPLRVGLAGRPGTRSRRERGVRRCRSLSLLSACHRKIESLLVAGAYRYVVLGVGFSPYKGSKSMPCSISCFFDKLSTFLLSFFMARHLFVSSKQDFLGIFLRLLPCGAKPAGGSLAHSPRAGEPPHFISVPCSRTPLPCPIRSRERQ